MRANSVTWLILFVLFNIGAARLCLCRNSTSDCIERERLALLSLKASLYGLSNRLFSWKGEHCCQWNGVGCDNITGHVVKLDLRTGCIDYSCEGSYYLDAKNANSCLLELEYLNYLDLSGIYFQESPIPAFFGSMKHLTYLNLSSTYFGGRVPHVLGNLTNLRVLDLSGLLYTSMDDFSWVSKLLHLQYLDMSAVDLSKTRNLMLVLNLLPSLLEVKLNDVGISDIQIDIPLSSIHNVTLLSRLQVLELGYNQLNGSFLDAFQNMTSIRVLDLSGNQLTSLPSWFSKFKGLIRLSLSHNRIFGSIPSAVQNLTSLRVLELKGNNLNLVPSWFDNFRGLIHLDLFGNAFEGPIPEVLQNMTQLRFLDLSFNNLTSSVPQWLGKLKKLVHLNLALNKFTSIDGTLSSILRDYCEIQSLDLSFNNFQGEALGRLNNLSRCKRYELEELYLSHNNFSGPLPNWLGRMKNLKYINLDSNSFFGPIPLSLGELLNMAELHLSQNHLQGEVPIFLGQLLGLNVLDLSHNDLNGTIPLSLGQLANLKKLSLSNNHLSGVIPENFVDLMPNLEDLLLASNLLNGSIPSSLCAQNYLSNLDLSKNSLSGTIPDCWKKNHEMYLIDLSSNKLSGTIPSSFGNLLSLQWLHLNTNNLQGELPLSLKNCTDLIILDLGENHLQGVIPSWIGENFSSLQILRLRQNMFHGRISLHLCQLLSLQIMDLANNNLIGSIPHCFGNLRGMVEEVPPDKNTLDVYLAEWDNEIMKQILKGRELDYTKNLRLLVNMDLSCNNLVGIIPNYITALSGLHGLNLSHNRLSGGIPHIIGNMKSLESIDLCCNQFSGKIPISMSALTSLSYLNLSHNNLSGQIPQDTQFSTFNDASSYAGNPYLCGPPLRQCHTASKTPESSGNEENDHEKVWFYFVIAVGFATGFWGVIGVLIFKKSWRLAYFQCADNIMEKIYVSVAIMVAKLKRKNQRNHAEECIVPCFFFFFFLIIPVSDKNVLRLCNSLFTSVDGSHVSI